MKMKDLFQILNLQPLYIDPESVFCGFCHYNDENIIVKDKLK